MSPYIDDISGQLALCVQEQVVVVRGNGGRGAVGVLFHDTPAYCLSHVGEPAAALLTLLVCYCSPGAVVPSSMHLLRLAVLCSMCLV